MKMASSDDDRIQQDPRDGGIWATAPLEREIHAEGLRAMKVTLAAVDRQIRAIAQAATPPGFSTGDVDGGNESEHVR